MIYIHSQTPAAESDCIPKYRRFHADLTYYCDCIPGLTIPNVLIRLFSETQT